MEISAVASSSKSIEQVNNVMQYAVAKSTQTAKKILQASVGVKGAVALNPNSSTGQNVDTVA